MIGINFNQLTGDQKMRMIIKLFHYKKRGRRTKEKTLYFYL